MAAEKLRIDKENMKRQMLEALFGRVEKQTVENAAEKIRKYKKQKEDEEPVEEVDEVKGDGDNKKENAEEHD